MTGSRGRQCRIGLLVSAFVVGRAFAGTTSLSLGADYARGDYGSGETTRTWTLPLALKHESGPWLWRASLPYVRVEGTFSRDAASGPGQGAGEATPPSESQSGFGDVTLGVFRTVHDTRRLVVDVGAKVKLATADKTKTLITTGENDYSLQADLFRPLAAASLFASLGYTRKGDPDGIDYRNPFYGALGVSRPLAAGQSAGAAWDFRQKASPTGDALSELSLFYNRKLDSTDKLQLYVVQGLADGSPDFGAGVVLTRSY